MDDPKWRERINQRIDDRLDEIEGEIHSLKEMLNGKDNVRDDNGLTGDVESILGRLRRIDGILWQDQAGNAGLVSDVIKLKKREGLEERNMEYRWKFWTALAVAMFSLAGLIVKEWPAISQRWNTNMEQLTEDKPHGKKTKHKRRAIEQEVNDGSNDAVQD